MSTLKLITVGLVFFSLAGCANMTPRERNTALGAGAGAVGGALLTGGDTMGVVGGAAVGGIVGNQIKH
ncbi:MAG: glycine zipper 2TM domain-containing protein [Halothiobacillus sp.]